MADGPDLAREIAVEATEEEWVELATPAARLWARMFDIWILSFFVGILLGVMFPAEIGGLASYGAAANLLLNLATLPFVMLIDTIILTLLGTTPGKWLVGIRIETLDGRRIGQVALARNFRIYLEGLWLGLPLLNLLGMSRARDRLLNEGATGWDERLGTRVIERGSNELRTIAVAVLALAMYIGAAIFEKYAQYKQPEWDRAEIVEVLPQLNQGLPHFLDDVTRMDRIDYQPEENVLTLDYTLIHRDGSPVRPSEAPGLAQGRAGMIGHYCGPSLKVFRERNVPVRYRYRQDRGEIIFETVFDAGDCAPAR